MYMRESFHLHVLKTYLREFKCLRVSCYDCKLRFGNSTFMLTLQKKNNRINTLFRAQTEPNYGL